MIRSRAKLTSEGHLPKVQVPFKTECLQAATSTLGHGSCLPVQVTGIFGYNPRTYDDIRSSLPEERTVGAIIL